MFSPLTAGYFVCVQDSTKSTGWISDHLVGGQGMGLLVQIWVFLLFFHVPEPFENQGVFPHFP